MVMWSWEKKLQKKEHLIQTYAMPSVYLLSIMYNASGVWNFNVDINIYGVHSSHTWIEVNKLCIYVCSR